MWEETVAYRFFTNSDLKDWLLQACCLSLGRLGEFKKEGFFNSFNVETKSRLCLPTCMAEFTNIPAGGGRLSGFQFSLPGCGPLSPSGVQLSDSPVFAHMSGGELCKPITLIGCVVMTDDAIRLKARKPIAVGLNSSRGSCWCLYLGVSRLSDLFWSSSSNSTLSRPRWLA